MKNPKDEFQRRVRAYRVRPENFRGPPVKRFTPEEIAALAASRGVAASPEAGRSFPAGLRLSRTGLNTKAPPTFPWLPVARAGR